ncbi:hypothetical protein J6590_042347 [Homalodisca vitripennis]|nr:hypothetical protein J6590_042347 [Homalodisca vitripennis]
MSSEGVQTLSTLSLATSLAIGEYACRPSYPARTTVSACARSKPHSPQHDAWALERVVLGRATRGVGYLVVGAFNPLLTKLHASWCDLYHQTGLFINRCIVCKGSVGRKTKSENIKS